MMKMRLWGEMSRADKLNLLVSLFIITTLIIAIPLSVYEKNWMALFVSLLTFFLVFIPRFFEEWYKIKLIAELEIIIVLFIYAGLFLGEVRGYYVKFWWWDSLLHAFSGVALGFVGFLILYIFYKTGRLSAGFKMIALFSFCFAVALGALWEIFEFFVDSTLGANMQKARGLVGDTRLGVMDTMWDITLNAIGSFFASTVGYFYLKKGEMPIIKKIIEKFEKKNPHLFKKSRRRWK